MSVNPCPPKDFFTLISTGEPLSTVERGLAFVDEMVEAIDAQIGDSIAGQLIPAESVVDALRDKLNGLIDSKLDDADAAACKCEQTVNITIDRSFNTIDEYIRELNESYGGQAIDLSERLTIDNSDDSTVINEASDTRCATNKADCPPCPVVEQQTTKEGIVEQAGDKPVATLKYCLYKNSTGDCIYMRECDKGKNLPGDTLLRSFAIFDHAWEAWKAALRDLADELSKKGKRINCDAVSDPFLDRLVADLYATRTPIIPCDDFERGLDLFNKQQWENFFPSWRDSNPCEELDKVITDKVPPCPYPISRMAGLMDHNCNHIVPSWATDMLGWIPFFGDAAAQSFAKMARLLTESIDKAIYVYAKATHCNVYCLIRPLLARVVHTFVTKWVGIEIPRLNDILDRIFNYACPTQIPSSAELNSMYLSGAIDEKQWECLVRANNDIPERQKDAVNALRARPGIHDIVSLYMRGKMSESKMKERLRYNGVLTQDEEKQFVDLHWTVPTTADLIPMMVRDVFDETVVKEFKQDAEFGKKFTARAKELFTAAGVTEETAKLHWRAHWQFPSNTALFEMFHRLRGGKELTEFYQYEDDEGNPLPEPKRLTKDDIKVTDRDLMRVMGINDYAPFWRARLGAISRPPLTRVDVRRAYEIGAITETEVYESYRDLGYDEQNAATLTKFSKMLKDKANVRKHGKILPSKITAMYRRQEITSIEAIALLKSNGIAEDDAKETLKQADIEVKAKRRGTCIKAIRKRYLTADIDEGDVVKMLQALDMEDEQVFAIRDELRCERNHRSKEVTASVLCKWYQNGLIERENYIRRLIRIGYHKIDAEHIAEVCDFEAAKKEEKGDVKGRMKKPQGNGAAK